MPLLKPQQEPEKEEPPVTVEQVITQKGEGFFSGMGKIFRRLSSIHAPPGLKEFGRTIWLGKETKRKGDRWKGVTPYSWNLNAKKRRKR